MTLLALTFVLGFTASLKAHACLARFSSPPNPLSSYPGLSEIVESSRLFSRSQNHSDRCLPLLDPSNPLGALPGGRDWTLDSGNSYTGHLSTHFAPSLTEPDLFAAGPPRDPPANLAALAVPAPGMGTALDALGTQPLNTRRPQAPSLPSFELPPPPFPGAPLKYSMQSNHPPLSHPPTTVSVGNLLTPPATNQSGRTTVSQTLAPSMGVSSDLPPAYWPGTSPYGGGSAPPQWAPGVNPAYHARNSYSPSGPGGRPAAVTSPPTTDGLSHPFEVPPLTSFPQAVPASSSSMAPSAHPVTMGLYPSGTSPASLSSNDLYNHRGHTLYGASSHQAEYSPIYGSSSTGPAVLGMHPGGRMPAHSPGGQPPLAFPRQPWPSYSLPAMNGAVMSNVHSPSSPMSVMGGMQPGLLPGFNSGHVANSHHLYGAHMAPHGHSTPAADRPFKCDQCPQSFNRNHDLKRHKRIHLAVKPFPCNHCDKSFSRKDALKVCPQTPCLSHEYHANPI